MKQTREELLKRRRELEKELTEVKDNLNIDYGKEVWVNTGFGVKKGTRIKSRSRYNVKVLYETGFQHDASLDSVFETKEEALKALVKDCEYEKNKYEKYLAKATEKLEKFKNDLEEERSKNGAAL